jgi:FtsZ-interacting cell division protein ZipA
MLVQASITGLVRTVLIIIGVIVVARFLGQLMTARRHMAEQKADEKRRREFERTRNHVEKNKGRVNIIGKEQSTGNAEYVDYEEVKE